MNKKQLAEMIKTLRKKKLDEIIGKPGKFDPKHKTTHPEDPTSPNQPFHEEKLDEVLGGTYHKRRKNIFKSRLKPSQRTWTKKGQQSMSSGKRYTAEEEKKLGSTDTNQSGETVDMNPNIPTAKGETKKNTTVKETKEK
jgi:hypothetical protein